MQHLEGSGTPILYIVGTALKGYGKRRTASNGIFMISSRCANPVTKEKEG
jgi:hypothetical protein